MPVLPTFTVLLVNWKKGSVPVLVMFPSTSENSSATVKVPPLSVKRGPESIRLPFKLTKSFPVVIVLGSNCRKLFVPVPVRVPAICSKSSPMDKVPLVTSRSCPLRVTSTPELT